MSLDCPDSPFSNELEDTKLAVYNAIEEVKPVYYKLNDDGSKSEDILNDDSDDYKVDCELYKWFVTYFDDIINNDKILKKVLVLFEDYYKSLEENTADTDNSNDGISLLAENEPEDTVIIEDNNTIEDLDNSDSNSDNIVENPEDSDTNDSLIDDNEDTNEPNIDPALLEVYEKANKLLKDTVFDSDSTIYNASILDHYEFSDI
jgi:hypothetical protein